MIDCPEEYYDETYSELVENADADSEEFQTTAEEFMEQRDEFQRLVEVFSTAHMLAEMFMEDEITFGEYTELTESLMEKERDLDMGLL